MYAWQSVGSDSQKSLGTCSIHHTPSSSASFSKPQLGDAQRGTVRRGVKDNESKVLIMSTNQMSSREIVHSPHASKILPPLVTRGGADPQDHPLFRACDPPARGFQTAAQWSENKCSPPCPQLLPPLSPHLEYYANNNGVLLGKRDLIAAYTPREGKIGFSPDLSPVFIFSYFPFSSFPSPRSFSLLSAPSQHPVTNPKCMKKARDALFFFLFNIF